MADRLRSIGCYLFVVALLGGLWLYADLQRRIAQEIHLPPSEARQVPPVPPQAPAIAGIGSDPPPGE